jgi:NAD kinase
LYIKEADNARIEAERRLAEVQDKFGELEKKYKSLLVDSERTLHATRRDAPYGGGLERSVSEYEGRQWTKRGSSMKQVSGSTSGVGAGLRLGRRHTVSEPQGFASSSPLMPDPLTSSLGLWFLLSHVTPYNTNEEGEGGLVDQRRNQLEGNHHHATVSVANDGRASVGTAAAAAVSIALAKSWTSASISSKSGSGQHLAERAGSGDSSNMVRESKARFRLVAAVPKGPGIMYDEKKESIDREDSIPVDHLNPNEESTSEWAAYGAHLKLQWMSKPKKVLVVFKLADDAFEAACEAIKILLRESIHVYVEPDVFGRIQTCCIDATCDDSETHRHHHLLLHTWDVSSCHCSDTIPEDVGSNLDLIFTVGGDGTVLWVCSLLGILGSVPPIVAFSMGSLGFMTPFSVARLEKTITSVISPKYNLPLMLRHRLQCRIIRHGQLKESFQMLDKAPCGEDVLVLNEVVIDRGMTACLTKLECYIDNNFVTVIQGDGLIISTPTGSTAYNLAAGGSMVHPAVPCILFTPICPHTLSSRPLVFPEHVMLRLKVPSDSKDGLYCSFDGKSRKHLRPGDSVVVYSSQSPVPMVCHLDASHDWFTSVREGLDWNRRTVQKASQGLLSS